jgi:FkbM family methyltransferase
MIKRILKIFLYPLLLFHRAYRIYVYGKDATSWTNRIEDGEILVSMNTPKGQFYINSKSHFISAAIRGEHERKLMRQIENLKINDGLIINIGANIGFYSIHLANCYLNHKIIALEPNPEAYTLLVRNIEQNNLSQKVQALNVCVSDKTGTIPFTIIRGKSEYSSINNIVHESVELEKKEVINVSSLTLNEIVKDDKIALIFMDVEGAENLILESNRDIIVRDKPWIFCECNDLLLRNFNSTSLKLVKTLQSLGYIVLNSEAKRNKIHHPFHGNIVGVSKSTLEKGNVG